MKNAEGVWVKGGERSVPFGFENVFWNPGKGE